MKILLVEDDQRTADFIIKGLKQHHHTVDHANNGKDGLLKASTENYDAAIIDVMMPKLDGISLVKLLRETGGTLPVLMLSARSTVDDRVKGLDAGSDDYLVKPFSFVELLARLNALLRRQAPVQLQELRVANLRIDLVRHKVYRDEKELFLQPLELQLLEYLMRHAGKVVSKTMIMEQVWDYHFDPQTNVVEARICRLRDKVDRNHEPKLIHTVRGVGYVLEER